MLRTRRWSPKTKAALAVATALLLWIPTGISEVTQPVVTGHSTFFNGSGYDPCLASVAGILRTQVMWFNDMVLVERYGGKGTFIWATEQGGMDPRLARYLYTEGTSYDFRDPNGATWHVEELFISGSLGHYQANPNTHIDWDDEIEGDVGEVAGYNPQTDPAPNPQTDDPPTPAPPKVNASPTANATLDNRSKRQYVWTVELSERPIHDQFAGDPNGPYYHDVYNFVLLLDTCKMKRQNSQPGRVAGPGDPYNVTHNGTESGHPLNETAHFHEMHLVDLYVSTEPVIVPWAPDPADDQPVWQAEWFTNETGHGPDHVRRSGEAAANQTGVSH